MDEGLISRLWRSAAGPRMLAGPGGPYGPAAAEAWGDRALRSLRLLWALALYGSPVLANYFYRRDPPMQPQAFIKPAALLACFTAASYGLRALGRFANPRYQEFLRVLRAPENRTALRKYDFELYAWPLDFDCSRGEPSNSKFIRPGENREGLAETVKHFLGLIAVRTIGLAIIYPGSTSLLGFFVDATLLEARIKLVEENDGKRSKIKTADGNFIDCMFFDRTATEKGKTLVITSEGNAGFYEIGIVTTPLEAGYSVLGWNHPGFGASTGRPFPLEEQHAIDAVVRFAVEKLEFAPENIILYGWSIGCYAVAWAASQYPTVQGVVMDATFDDLLPLAVSRMPACLEPAVKEIVKGHVDLNVAEILKGYSGPLKFIRRTFDEIISIDPGNLATNRGNDLAIETLAHRHPDLISGSGRDLAAKYLSDKINPGSRSNLVQNHPGDSERNKRVLALVEKYVSDFQSTHCTPLPVEYLTVNA